jgi:hypothetical protein
MLACLIGETIADQQQWNFHQRKKAQIAAGGVPDLNFCQTGLFRFARHPNYFFEIAQWWLLFGIGAAAAGSLLQWTGIGALLLTGLFIGSTRLTERISLSKYPEYADYQARTSPIIPWPPRQVPSESGVHGKVDLVVGRYRMGLALRVGLTGILALAISAGRQPGSACGRHRDAEPPTPGNRKHPESRVPSIPHVHYLQRASLHLPAARLHPRPMGKSCASTQRKATLAGTRAFGGCHPFGCWPRSATPRAPATGQPARISCPRLHSGPVQRGCRPPAPSTD